jgi:hypothetical protein
VGTGAEKTPALAVELGRRTRLSVGAIGLGSAVGVVLLLILYPAGDVPDLFATTLAIGALGGVFLAVIGRLPSGFEIGGMKLDFPQGGLSDLIGTVKSALDDDPEASNKILTMIESAAGTREYRVAEKSLEGHAQAGERVDRAVAHPSRLDEGLEEQEGDPLPDNQEGVLVEQLRRLADRGNFLERYAIPNSGRGKPPIFDYAFERGGRQIVLEVEEYSNPSTVDLINRKAKRALGEETGVAAVIIVASDAGKSAFEDGVQRDRVLVVSPDELRGRKFENLVDELLSGAN